MRMHEWHRIREWQQRIHLNNVNHGFYDGPGADNIDRKLLLAVGEIIEAQNELRKGNAPTTIYYAVGADTKPEGFGIEIADAIIRLLDIAERLRVNVEQCMELKHEYNLTREYKHGKVF